MLNVHKYVFFKKIYLFAWQGRMRLLLFPFIYVVSSIQFSRRWASPFDGRAGAFWFRKLDFADYQLHDSRVDHSVGHFSCR